MQQAFAMQRGDAVDELAQRLAEPIDVEARPIWTANAVDEVHAADQLHREERPIVFDEQLVETDNAGMRDVGEAAELTLEPVEVDRAGAAQGLQRDGFIPMRVVRFIDDPHAAAAERADDAKAIGAREFGGVLIR